MLTLHVRRGSVLRLQGGNPFSPCSGTLLAHSAALLECRGLSRSSARVCLNDTARPYSASEANRLSAVFIDACVAKLRHSPRAAASAAASRSVAQYVPK